MLNFTTIKIKYKYTEEKHIDMICERMWVCVLIYDYNEYNKLNGKHFRKRGTSLILCQMGGLKNRATYYR